LTWLGDDFPIRSRPGGGHFLGRHDVDTGPDLVAKVMVMHSPRTSSRLTRYFCFDRRAGSERSCFLASSISDGTAPFLNGGQTAPLLAQRFLARGNLGFLDCCCAATRRCVLTCSSSC